MINRQFSYDSYYPPVMPFFSTEESKNQEEIWPLESNSQSSISTPYKSTTSYQQKLQFMPVINNPPSLFTSNSFNLYPTETLPTHELYTGFLKPVQERIGYDGLPIGLNLSELSYFSSCQTRNFEYKHWRSSGYLYGHQRPRCQAEGCKADLSNAKRYHRRHKVCEFHSKASVVIVSGRLQQRFCQQCSRFHSLDEFDEAKKSCRKRLADHNRRRRKPQSPSSTSTKTLTNVVTKNKQAPKATKCRTSTTTVMHGDGENTEGKNVCSVKPAKKIGSSAVEMGCTGSKVQPNHSEAFDLFSNDCLIRRHPIQSCSSNIFFDQQNLPCSSSIGALETIEDDYELSHQHYHNLQVGDVMFGMDFLQHSI